MSKVRVHNFSISLDGYAAGPEQNIDNPLGVGGERLHEWAFVTRTFRQMHGMEGGSTGIDDGFAAQGGAGAGATIMGRAPAADAVARHRIGGERRLSRRRPR